MTSCIVVLSNLVFQLCLVWGVFIALKGHSF